METNDAIKKRKSVRKFKQRDLSDNVLKQLLKLATEAPSAKNSQPWQFLVLKNSSKDRISEIMLKKAKEIEKKGVSIGSVKNSAGVIKQAPVLLIVYNTNKKHYLVAEKNYVDIWRSVDIQSIGASIQNILLAAADMGLGSLWIGDIFIDQEGINSYLDNENNELVAAISLGYPDEKPRKMDRKSLNKVVKWVRD